MSENKKVTTHIILSIGSVVLAGLTALLIKFGYTMIREDAEHLCYTASGGTSIAFYPDTRWLGISMFFLIGTAFLLAKVLNKRADKIFALLLVACGIVALIFPELIR